MSEDSASPNALPPPLNPDEARKLNGRIRQTADTAGKQLAELAALVAQAKAGNIHHALGFPSWSAYSADALKPLTRSLDRNQTRELVAELWDQGMSVRGISEATGVPRSTVGDQVSGTGHVGHTTGLDDKSYPRRGGGGYRGILRPDMRLDRAVKTIANIDPAAAEDHDALRQQLEDARKRINEAIDHHLERINAAQPTDLDSVA